MDHIIALQFVNGILSYLITKFLFLIGLPFSHDKYRFHKDDSLEIINPNWMCLGFNEERLVPIELIDELTLRDSSIWCNKEKHINREAIQESSLESFQGLVSRTNTIGEKNTDFREIAAIGEISIGSRICEQDQLYVNNNQTNDHDQNTTPYRNSLFETASIDLDTRSLDAKSEPSYHKFDEIEEKTGNVFSNSYHSLFEITPIKTTPRLNPNTSSGSRPSQPISNELEGKKTKNLFPSSTWLDSNELIMRNQEEIQSEIFGRLDELLNDFEQEKISIQEKLKELEQRFSVTQKEDQKKKPILEEDSYESLADVLHCEMNYSSNDLVSLGNIRSGTNRKINFDMKKNFERNFSSRAFDLEILEENDRMEIEDEFGDLRARLRDIEANRELIDQCVKSLEKEGERKDVIQDILMQIDKFRRV